MCVAYTVTALALVFLGAACGLVRAQSPSPSSVEIDFDSRARIAVEGKSGVKLHTSAIRTITDLAPGLRFEAYGTNKYNSPCGTASIRGKRRGGKSLSGRAYPPSLRYL